MPKLYKEGEVAPSMTNEYYKIKMREYRARKGNEQQAYWSLTIDNKIYIFKKKADINIKRINKENIDKSKHVICY